MVALLAMGCQGIQPAAFHTASDSSSISGTLHGGRQPIAGASIELYAAGIGGDGSTATPLLTSAVTTNSSGAFNLTGLYACPTATTEVYLVATGGNPGLMNGGTNAQIALMAALGPCGNLTATTSVEINEVTTVAATYALAPYMQSYSAVGSSTADAQLMASAFTMAAELANIGTGGTPGVGVPTGQTVPSQKLTTLANIVSVCVNSSGGTTGDSSSCGQLFSLASASSSAAATDTVGALLDIAQNPTTNVVPIFDLEPPTGPFQPSLSSVPADWTLAITSPTPSPTFSPAPGTYATLPPVTLSDSNSSAAIYYTTDGSQPTSSSIPYTGAIALSGTTTIRAVAIAGGISSLLAAGTYALAAPTIALTPSSATLTSSQTHAFTATVSGTSNTAVTWSVSPSIGSISAAGLYTAPASITSAQMVTVSATSVADSSVAASASVSLAPPVSVALTPGSVTLAPSQTQAFTATVANTSNTTVTWLLSPAMGSISAGGLYTAPASITSAQTVTATATSVADSTKSASASVALAPHVSVALSPGSVTLTTSQTQAFTATVSNSSNTAVTWSLSPAVGSISAGGVYTAPATIASAQTITVTATSVANSTKSASSSVSLTPPVSVGLTPGSVTLTPSQTQMFTASVAGTSNTAVTWSLSPAVGSISAAGLYTAPTSIASAQTITVKATSVADSTKTASASVSLAPPVSIGLTPGSVTLTPSQTQAFTASVANSSNTTVTWSLSPAVGSISAAGLYSAPASITSTQAVTVTATSVANPTKSASSSVSLVPPVSVALTPGSVTLTPSQTQTFSATVANTSNTAVTWLLSPAVGSISAAGLYTAPASITAAQTVTVTATSVADSTKTASAAVSLAPPVSIGLTPGSVTLTPSQTQAFTATVRGSSNTAVTWSLSPAVGSISAGGLYTAPASISAAQTVTVTAISVADSTKSATAIISLTPPVGVSLTPATVTLGQSQSQSFAASVANTSNTAVTWSLSPAVGAISAGGLYTAPASIPSAQTVTVTATSVADSTKSASASVSLAPPVSVALTPGTVTLAPSQTQMFTASVAGTSNTAVTWSLSPAVGSITAAGLYTAPATVPYPNSVTITATSVADPTKSASVGVTIVPLVGTTYYLAPAAAGGKDSNSGLSPGAPWLTPNHAVNCGDVITAAAGTYRGLNFNYGDWGDVTCPAGFGVAWVVCSAFDECKVTGDGYGIVIDHSYWGIQGFEVTTTMAHAACFQATPNYASPIEIHHIIFANNIANRCQASGFSAVNQTTTAGVDYIAILGNITYNASLSSAECYSGISIYQPIQLDSLPGTHIYVAGNLSSGNFEPNPCAGGIPTDGDGIIFDAFDGDQGEFPNPYRAQAVADNNLLVANGGRGLQVFANSTGTSPFASIYLRHNTMWGNNGDQNQTSILCGELLFDSAFTSQAFLNLAATNKVTGCGTNPISAYYVHKGNGSDFVYQNWGYAVSGVADGVASSTGFSYDPNNIFGINPNFADPVAPSLPNCGGYASVPACMASVIANFTPTNTAALTYGYQIPSVTPIYDPLFPQWLCNVSLPTGLVSMGCKAGP